MTDVQLDVLVASDSPISEVRVVSLSLGDIEAELLEAILALPRDEPLRPTGWSTRGRKAPVDVVAITDPRPVRHRPRRLLAAVGVAAAVLVSALVSQHSGSDRPSDVVSSDPSAPASSTTSTTAPEPVELVPGPWAKYLVDLPGWRLIGMGVRERDGRYEADFTYSDGERDLGVTWQQGPGAQPYHEDYDMFPPMEVLGHQAWLWQSKEEKEATQLRLADPARTDAFHAAWANAPRDFVQVWGDFPTVESFLDVVHALRPVDDATFSVARPADYVVPDDQPAVIDEMLTGIPRPPGFDVAELVEPNGGVGVDRPSLADPVVKATTCGWVEAWVLASDAGDADGARQAMKAMARLVDWPVLAELDGYDDDYYRTMVAEFADALATGRPVTLTRTSSAEVSGEEYRLKPVPLPGEPAPVRDVWSDLLHCQGGPWTIN